MGGRFLTPLRVEEVSHDLWRLLEPLAYKSSLLGRTVQIQAGFVTDLASIPRWLPLARVLLRGHARRAAVLHDAAYRYGAPLARNRLKADRLMLEAMKAQETGRIRRALIYGGVRAGSWWTWNRYRREG